MDLEIPTTIDAFDVDFLNEVFADSDGGAAVTGVRSERIGVGEGFLGELARLHLTYAVDGAGPATVVAKIPAGDAGFKALGVALGVYEREARFYAELAPRMNVRLPAIYYNGHDPAADAYALLMEDVGHLRRCAPIVGADLDDARAVVRVAARIHAAWWDNAALAAMDWVPPVDSPVNMSLPTFYEASWSTVMDRYGHLYPEHLRRDLERFIAELASYLGNSAAISRTLSHNDFRLDNLLFEDRTDGGGPDVAVIDFQMVGRGDGSSDLAQFIGSNLETDLRRTHEIDLLRSYHEAMHAAGAGVEHFDDLVRAIDTSHVFWLVNFANTAVMAGQTSVDGDAMWDAVVRRCVSTVLDREATQYIDDMHWQPR